jgi:phosphatidylglycerophosphate synthase
MRSLPRDKECPVDTLILDMCEEVAPFFHKTGHSANVITFEGALLSAYGIYSLWQRNLVPFAIFYALGYAFDCLDGFYARKYNMVSTFGEYFEHAKDIATTWIFFLVLYKRYTIPPWAVKTLFITGVGLCIHMGHQQAYLREKNEKKKKKREFLNVLLPLVKSPRFIKYTRWLGCGTFMLTCITIPFFLKKRSLFQ